MAPKVEEQIKTRAIGNFTVAETLYDGYLNLINAHDITFGEQEVLLNAIESGMFEEMVQNLKPDIFSMANTSDGAKFELLLIKLYFNSGSLE